MILSNLFYGALGSLKMYFSLKEAEELTFYAIVGSQPILQDALKKVKHLDILDFNTELINFELFCTSVPDIRNKKLDTEKQKYYNFYNFMILLIDIAHQIKQVKVSINLKHLILLQTLLLMKSIKLNKNKLLQRSVGFYMKKISHFGIL